MHNHDFGVKFMKLFYMFHFNVYHVTYLFVWEPVDGFHNSEEVINTFILQMVIAGFVYRFGNKLLKSRNLNLC